MTIDPINQPKNIPSTSKSKGVPSNGSPTPPDKVSISKEAQHHVLIQNYINIVKNTPDIRQDAVDKAKAHLDSYFEANGQIKTEVIDRLTELLSRDLP